MTGLAIFCNLAGNSVVYAINNGGGNAVSNATAIDIVFQFSDI